jgi:hypothetical protein
MGTSQRENFKHRHEKLLTQDIIFSSELRVVIVMFISIDFDKPNSLQLQVDHPHLYDVYQSFTDLPDPDLDDIFLDNAASTCFQFLKRTKNEIVSDNLLLNKFQVCMEVVTSVFKETMGQLRQFIVDDKG